MKSEPCTASRVGTKARGILSSPGFIGEVSAIVSGTIYLCNQEGEVFWICAEGFPFHRRCVMVHTLPAVFRGERCFWQCPRLMFGSGSFIDIGTAEEWHPPAATAARPALLAALWARFLRLLPALDLLKVQEGMGMTISLTHALAEGTDVPHLPPISIMGHARGAAVELAQACLNQDLSAVVRVGKPLIGLGCGLTPSGDDFLGACCSPRGLCIKVVRRICLGMNTRFSIFWTGLKTALTPSAEPFSAISPSATDRSPCMT